MITIDNAQNGYIITYEKDFDDDGNNTTPSPMVFKSRDDALSEAKAMQRLLCQVMEDLGYMTSKHNQYNVRITVVDNDEVEV